METSLAPYLVLTHAYSQLYSRAMSFTPSIFSHEAALDGMDNLGAFMSWGSQDWRHFIKRDKENPSGYLSFLRYEKVDINFLIAQLCDHLQACHKFGARYILQHDPAYPKLLHHIDNPPLAITCLGNCDLLDTDMIAVIGSRNAHHSSIEQAFTLGNRLAQLGLTCVSGGAFGCDIAAHRGVLENGGDVAAAIVVFASGLGHPDPSGNRQTFLALKQQGGLWLSERLWQQKAQPFDFPIRNRIIAGLTRETIVIQAGIKSGAMITALKALDEGREVLTLRLDTSLPNTDGNQRLIEDGSYSFNFVDELLLNYRFWHER